MTQTQLIRDYRDFVLRDPCAATNAGEHARDHLLSDLTEEYEQQRLGDARRLLRRVAEVNTARLEFDAAIDTELMRLALEKWIFLHELEYNGLRDREQKPRIGSAVIEAFQYLFLKDPRPAHERLRAVESRLKRIPEMVAGYRAVLKRPVPRWRDIEMEELDALPDLFTGMTAWAEQERFPDLAALRSGVERAGAALADYREHLLRLPAGDVFTIGSAAAGELARLNGIDRDLEGIHRTAVEFFLRHDERIRELGARLARKYGLPGRAAVAEILDLVKRRFSVPLDEVVARYRSEQQRVLDFIHRTGLFILPESEELLILQTPAYQVPTIPVGAMFPPAPFEQGPKKSLVYVTIDAGRSLDQNALMITNTMIHEGIPGHHLQLSFAAGHDSVVRRLAEYNTHAEGWTTYLEEFMSGAGFIDPEVIDEYLLVALADFARLGARVAIDLYFMTGVEDYLQVIEGFTPAGDTAFARAGDLLRRATGFTAARCEGELNWYSRERGYPMCYLLGNDMARQLKQDLAARIGNADQADRIFHDQYLRQGALTIPMLRRILRHQGYL